MNKKMWAVLVAALVALIGVVVVVGQAATTDVTVRVGKTVRVGLVADSIVADPAGVSSIAVKMRFDSRYLTPDTTGMDLGVEGATTSAITVESIPNDTNNKLLTATVTFPTPSPVTSATTGQLFALRFKAAAPGTSVFTVDACTVNADPEFVATGAPSPNVVVRPIQKLQYRLTVTSS